MALGTALVLVTYVTPMATVTATAADLGAGPAGRAWILSSMSVGLAAALLAAGVLGDTLGRRRVYLAGLGAVGVGALVCALAQGEVLFVAGRLLQGVGGAAVLSCGLAVLAHATTLGPERVRATSVWGASVGLGIGAGAVLAALLDQVTGWRTAYVVVVVLAAALVVPTLGRVASSSALVRRRPDVVGGLLLTAALAVLVSMLTEAREGVDGLVLALALGAVVLLGAFALVERCAPDPLVDTGLLRDPRFRSATLGSLVVGLGMIGLSAYVPAHGRLALGVSLMTASVPVLVWAGASVVAALLVRRIPHPLVGGGPVAVLLLVVAAGQLLTYGVDTAGELWRLSLAMAVAGAGTGVLNAILGRESVASVPADRAAMGSGANNTARYLGAACGITIVVSVVAAGATPAAGWDAAVLVVTGVTVLGAGVIALGSREARRPTG
ncbi:MFS transporter [Nocardioides nanhaiensis]|uniref:MFS transporter n=1 Tax=Nocardioides nanhaiensis TaxID=1476871 RepID=A0ABP8WI83_9ACTN